MELETGNDSSTDLAGDAGVVGRWLVQQRQAEGNGAQALQLDLKGVLYQASVVSTLLLLFSLMVPTDVRRQALTEEVVPQNHGNMHAQS